MTTSDDWTDDEQATAQRLSDRLRDLGIDPEDRSGILDDFVRIDARIAALRREETAARGKAKMSATRALNIATAERRRLHEALFKGARKVKPATPEITTESIAAAETEAVKAWRARWHRGEGPSEEELRAKYGPITWVALLYKTPAEEAEAERAIASNL